jgi:CheY-like chemotaxis protein
MSYTAPSRQLLKDWTILVVDDELDSLMVAQTLLERSGAKVLTAFNGKEGFELAKQYRPRFIITDLSMPEMNGWDLLTALKNNLATAAIPTIALTAHAMAGDREKAMSVGFTNYLSKPLVPYTFVKDVLNLLIDIPEVAALLKHVQ